jgi:hypothetical protein
MLFDDDPPHEPLRHGAASFLVRREGRQSINSF